MYIHTQESEWRKRVKKFGKLALSSFALGSMVLTGCNNLTLQPSNADKSSAVRSITKSSKIQEDDSWKKDVIYFMFVDRFYDGNPTNNNGNNPNQYDASKQNWKKYWGGDLEGVNQKLDYLKEMGITSIWVTPLVDSIDELTRDGDAPYHGYWGHDYFNIDEHLGTWDDFNNLITKMHSDEYGMRLCLDYAPNHSNPDDEGEMGALYKSLYDKNGNRIGRDTIIASFKEDYNNMYHNNGGVTNWNDYSQVTNNTLFNLTDFNQSNSDTYNYLADALEMWLKKGVDEVRIDAVKHMDIDFTKKLVNDMQNRLGKELFIYGEWSGAGAKIYGGVDAYAKTLENTTDCNLLDFGYRSTVEEMLLGEKNAKDLASYLMSRETYFANPGKQVVFLDNHDMARLNTTLRVKGRMSEEKAASKTDIGLALTMTVRGVPCIYYGTENYDANFNTNPFNVAGDDPYNRNMMTSFDGNTKAFKIIKSLAELRQTNTALQDGKYEERWQDETVLAFQRLNGNDVVATFINNGDTSRVMSIPNMSFDQGKYTSLIGNDEVTIINGTANLVIPANTAIVIAHTNSNISITPPVTDGTFTVKVKTGRNSEAIYFPGDYNGWSLTSNNLSAAPYSEVSFNINKAVTASTISAGDNNEKLELKLVTAASWDNQWNFRDWNTSSNITLTDNYRQINIDCNAGDNVTLLIDIANLSIIAEVNK